MEFERQLKKWGENSLVIVIPPDLAKFLEVDVDSTLVIRDELGKKGKYCSFWKKE